MQITFSWTCRECGKDTSLMRDSSTLPPFGVRLDGPTADVPLKCAFCGHTSAGLTVIYAYQGNHRPSWEKEAG